MAENEEAGNLHIVSSSNEMQNIGYPPLQTGKDTETRRIKKSGISKKPKQWE